MLSKQNRSLLFPIWPTFIGYKSAIINKGHPLWLAHHNIILFTLWTFSKGRICSPKLQEGSLQHRLQNWFLYVTMSPQFIPLVYYKPRPHMLTSTIENKNPSQPMRWDNMHLRGQFFSFWWVGGWVGEGRERNQTFLGNLVVPNVDQMIPSILTKCPMIIYYVFNLFLKLPISSQYQHNFSHVF
jgi:hypothetical protein